jgi:D-serine deaminase-like pyridoxal phosphate-dependent protein
MITKPTLLLDEDKCRRNIITMHSKARKNNLIFRPHFKTHQSLVIGRWFRDYGTEKITVSSLEMAVYFSSEWNDITVAFPVNILEMKTINSLAKKIRLNLLLESVDTITFLKMKLRYPVEFYIKIDIGNHRTGIDPSDTTEIQEILDVSDSSDMLKFKGFLGHAGQTYNCKTAEEIIEIQNKSLHVMNCLKQRYIKRYPDLITSIGDTPGCSIADNFKGADEIRPGNFVFYDLMQLEVGSCIADQIAVAMACPVVAMHKERNEIVVYGGGIHFSKDRIENEKEGTIFGRVAEKTEKGWSNIIPNMYVKSLSQEHGIVSAPDDETSKCKIGDTLIVLPVHSCMTANLMKSYLTLDGKRISGF